MKYTAMVNIKITRFRIIDNLVLCQSSFLLKTNKVAVYGRKNKVAGQYMSKDKNTAIKDKVKKIIFLGLNILAFLKSAISTLSINSTPAIVKITATSHEREKL